MSQVVQQEALSRLFVEKGIFTKVEFLDMVKVVDRERKKSPNELTKNLFQASLFGFNFAWNNITTCPGNRRPLPNSHFFSLIWFIYGVTFFIFTFLIVGRRNSKKRLKDGVNEKWGYWKSFRAVPFHRQLLTVKNLNHSRSLAEPCDLCLSKAAILKLWRYLRSTDSPNFFTPSEGLQGL